MFSTNVDHLTLISDYVSIISVKKEEVTPICQDDDDNDSPVVVKVVPAADWKPPTTATETENLGRRKSPRKPSPVAKKEDDKENEG